MTPQSIIPWLLMALRKHAATQLPPAQKPGELASSMENMPAMGQSVAAPAPHIPAIIPEVPGTQSPTVFRAPPKTVYQRKGVSPAEPARAPALALPVSQAPVVMENPPVVPEGVAPIDRSVDYAGRDESRAVSRAVDHKTEAANKHSGLVNTAHRQFVKRQERYARLPRKP